MTEIPKHNPTRFGRLRDTVACRIANWALNNIATPWYRMMIGGSIALGLETAARPSAAEGDS